AFFLRLGRDGLEDFEFVVAGVAAVVVSGHRQSRKSKVESRRSLRARAGGDEDLGGADDAVVERVAGLGGAGDRAGGMLVAGLLGEGLMEIGIEWSADGIDADGLMCF